MSETRVLALKRECVNGRHRKLAVGLAVCCLASLVILSGQQPNDQKPAFVANEIIVRFHPHVPPARRDVVAAVHRSRVLRRLEELHLDRIQLPAGISVEQALLSFKQRAEVMFAEPNFIRDAIASANDPYWTAGNLWGLQKIQAPSAWSLTTGNPAVVVANFDTGVNYNHPDLAANMWRNPGEIAGNGVDDDRNGYVDDVYGIDTANNDSDPMDDHGHGTHTAGTIGAVGNNGTGVVGVNWNVKILPCKFMKSDGRGSDSDAIECFNYVVALKKKGVDVRVTSNSWGSARSSSIPAGLKSAIDAAGAAGILNVFAAGNDGGNNDITPFDPASIPSESIVSVAASDSADNRASFSNYGATSVDLAAPGVSILSTRGSAYSSSSGTSMATPHVAGAAALLSGYNPTLVPTAVRALLMSNADKLPQWSGKLVSAGRLNLFASLLAVNDNVLPTVALTQPAAGSKYLSPASIGLAAAASDADGSIAKVDFHANGVLVGSDTAAPYTVTWANALAGSYDLTATATDNRGFSSMSLPVLVTVSNFVPTPDPPSPGTPSPARTNFAQAANGGTVLVSSTYSTTYLASYAIDGQRRATLYTKTWADKTASAYPDWLRVDFNGPKTISEIDVFNGQLDGKVDPTSTMTSAYTLRDFQVQYWTGSSWQTISGGTVNGNQLVWRKFTFAPRTTTAIRVLITRSGGTASRIAEIEAYE